MLNDLISNLNKQISDYKFKFEKQISKIKHVESLKNVMESKLVNASHLMFKSNLENENAI